MTDKTTDYAKSVVAGKVNVCKYVKLACERHIRDLGRQNTPDFPFIFDVEKAEKFFRFTRLLKHYKGAFAGKSLELLAWQCFVLGSIYGWVEAKTGNFRFRECHIEVPRKSGKTFMAAGIALYDCGLLEPTGVEVYLTATKYDQAKLVFNDATSIIKQSKDLSQFFRPLRSDIFASKSGNTSFIRPLGSDSKKLDGLNPVTVIFDELHAFEDRNLWDVMQGAFGARKNYHTISITTAGVNRLGICYENREQLIKILEGHFQNERVFGVIYTIDEGDEEKWDDEAVWLKANPSLGYGKELDYMKAMATKAKQVSTTLYDFLTKQLCVWVDAVSSWLNSVEWRECERSSPPELKNKQCFVGIDLARVGDLSAVAYFFPKQDGLEKAYALVRCYLPSENIQERETRDGAPYRNYAKAGFLCLTPGNVTDFDFIKTDILDAAKEWRIENIFYDRHFSHVLIDSLAKEGIAVAGFAQTSVNYNAPTLELERLIKSKAVEFEKNPLFAWQASNVVLTRDSSQNVKPDKDRESQKIDAMIALIMAVSGGTEIKHSGSQGIDSIVWDFSGY